MRFAGLDIGGRSHVVCIVDDDGAVLVRPTTFSEDAVGYAQRLALLGPATDVLVVLEATGHYGRNLCGYLAEQGFAFSVVNPLRTRRFAEGDLVRAKTDQVDALGIARFGAQKRPASTPLDSSLDDLRELVRYHHRVVQDYGDRSRPLHRRRTLPPREGLGDRRGEVRRF